MKKNTSSENFMITILGPTASGKTPFAAQLAYLLNGEIISADSRQVYQKMNIGTGKDYNDYHVNGEKIPYHLIDIAPPGYSYNLFEYQRDFLKAFKQIRAKNKAVLLCGGSGLYIDAVLQPYDLVDAPLDMQLRKTLEQKSLAELSQQLAEMRTLHNTTDTSNKKRVIRAIEIETYARKNKIHTNDIPEIRSLNLGIKNKRSTEREWITRRLDQRLAHGMIEEVKNLLDEGLTEEELTFYGLEYKFITWYITGKLSYQEMFNSLNTAIHQFAKRQMTWFRKMERNGTEIHWIDASSPMEEKLEITKNILASQEDYFNHLSNQL